MPRYHPGWTRRDYLEPDGASARVRDRLFVLHVLILVLLATIWLASLGPVPGIIAVLTAKHVLVALLMSRVERAPDSGDP
jgi:hypothetical protein